MSTGTWGADVEFILKQKKNIQKNKVFIWAYYVTKVYFLAAGLQPKAMLHCVELQMPPSSSSSTRSSECWLISVRETEKPAQGLR